MKEVGTPILVDNLHLSACCSKTCESPLQSKAAVLVVSHYPEPRCAANKWQRVTATSCTNIFGTRTWKATCSTCGQNLSTNTFDPDARAEKAVTPGNKHSDSFSMVERRELWQSHAWTRSYWNDHGYQVKF